MWRCTHMLTLVPRSRIFLPWRLRRYVPPKRRFTQDLQGTTSQKMTFFIVTAVKTSNLTNYLITYKSILLNYTEVPRRKLVSNTAYSSAIVDRRLTLKCKSKLFLEVIICSRSSFLCYIITSLSFIQSWTFKDRYHSMMYCQLLVEIVIIGWDSYCKWTEC
jgi:hypothetical protein